MSMSSQTLATDYRGLIARSQSVAIATCSEQGEAEVSYAPVLEYENTYYVYVSQLAKHTGNMQRQGQASIMFIEPEADAANPFARQRVIFNCSVNEIDKTHTLYQPLLDALQGRFGETVVVLRSLPDFHLLALTPLRGQYVAGFGKALAINTDNGELLPPSR